MSYLQDDKNIFIPVLNLRTTHRRGLNSGDSGSFSIIDKIAKTFWVAASFGLCYFCYTTWKLDEDNTSLRNNISISRRDDLYALPLNIQHDRFFSVVCIWQKNLSEMKKAWRMARFGCALILP